MNKIFLAGRKIQAQHILVTKDNSSSSISQSGKTDTPAAGLKVGMRYAHASRAADKPLSRADILFKVELALARMENGDYGYCAICRSEIPIEELETDPSTVSCQTCRRSDN
ncbi:MAG: hypothetical protein CBB65_05230 [Hyphomonadaceae bacterium TMED5]|nr:hypothetical protein [Ponticaulis sp.]OUX99498.1 MAG: hypothetical protein CBB65_05230 [Hyphomonadaceae bacterium TMED5]|tara:strand:- start:55305 stop:55637 length:333 start_codon:yes stop_codon:yes gene_type:complete